MTIEFWQRVLSSYATKGNPNEVLMATMLLDLSRIEDQRVEAVFDHVASQILEATL